MRNQAAVPMMACLLIGCATQPDNDVLAIGSAATVAVTPVVPMEDSGRTSPIFLEPGTLVTVEDDPVNYIQSADDIRACAEAVPQWREEILNTKPLTYEYPHFMASKRRIRLTVATGEHVGVTGAVQRMYLRPVPK